MRRPVHVARRVLRPRQAWGSARWPLRCGFAGWTLRHDPLSGNLPIRPTRWTERQRLGAGAIGGVVGRNVVTICVSIHAGRPWPGRAPRATASAWACAGEWESMAPVISRDRCGCLVHLDRMPQCVRAVHSPHSYARDAIHVLAASRTGLVAGSGGCARGCRCGRGCGRGCAEALGSPESVGACLARWASGPLLHPGTWRLSPLILAPLASTSDNHCYVRLSSVERVAGV
jgi:hypothetical protein